MLDGTTLQANPLGLKDGRFTRSMERDESGIERSRITYISIVAASLPPAPTGKVKKTAPYCSTALVRSAK